MKIKVAINGLGRIGRCVLRSIFENYSDNIELVMVNVPSNIENYIHLINYDSVHGVFKFQADSVNGDLIIDNKKIKISQERDINNINWQNVDIVLECSGKFNNHEMASNHIKNGAKKVIISAPCTDADATIIYGVNHQILTTNDAIISIGSCTTNCLAPIANIIHNNLEIEKGFITTIHSYTNDQRTLDNSHKDPRRARSCNLSMIPTSTGAAKTIDKILPSLSGKLDGAAVRVPTPNVSIIDCNFLVKKDSNIDEINNIFAAEIANDQLKILKYSDKPLVSIDYSHSTYSAIFDPLETKVIDNNLIRVLAWYDNEWGFSQRMLDVTRLVSSL